VARVDAFAVKARILKIGQGEAGGGRKERKRRKEGLREGGEEEGKRKGEGRIREEEGRRKGEGRIREEKGRGTRVAKEANPVLQMAQAVERSVP
jgi:hypothetical protein